MTAAARPLIAILCIFFLGILAIAQAAGLATGIPDWYVERFIELAGAYFITWSGMREYWKRRDRRVPLIPDTGGQDNVAK